MQLSKKPIVMIQGMTGKEGTNALKYMQSYNTQVLCGVTPKKGGQEIEGVPVYNSVKEALENHPSVDTSILYVPPLLVKHAALEAINAGVKRILVFAENVPIKDATIVLEHARKQGVEFIGPSAIGIINVGNWRIGSIGGTNPDHAFTPGPVSILSKSGGMCSETALMFTLANIGQSIVAGLGGDVISGTTFADIAPALEADERTKVIVIFGEIGGTYEQDLARIIKEGVITKPVIAYIAGTFAERIDRELAFGHAGAIIEGGQGTTRDKKETLTQAGVTVVQYHHELVDEVKKIVGEQSENTH